MDRERKKHIQTIKLVITEAVMIVSVVLVVILLMFIAMGYNVNKDGELNQQGLLQIDSVPTGATIAVDDSTLFLRTNMSKLLSAGDHQIALTKDGYDTWQKNVGVTEGRLYKLEYPRLFLMDRTPEVMREMEYELEFFEPATNRDGVIFAAADSPIWTFIDMRGDTAVDTMIDLTEILAGLKVKAVKWNKNSDHVLAETQNKDGDAEWLLVNIKNPKNSINLTKEFGLKFTVMDFLTDGGDRILALESGNLRLISASEKNLSQILATNVTKFAFNGDAVMYLTTDNEAKLLREGSDDIVVAKFDKERDVKILLFSYLDEKYICFTVDDKLNVYRGDYPNAERTLEDMDAVLDQQLSIVPDNLKIWVRNEAVVMQKDQRLAVFDAELDVVYEFDVENHQIFFVDDYLIGTIVDGKLVVRDFDGQNRREITTASGRAFITKNNKWLYYLNRADHKLSISREKVID